MGYVIMGSNGAHWGLSALCILCSRSYKVREAIMVSQIYSLVLHNDLRVRIDHCKEDYKSIQGFFVIWGYTWFMDDP